MKLSESMWKNLRQQKIAALLAKRTASSEITKAAIMEEIGGLKKQALEKLKEFEGVGTKISEARRQRAAVEGKIRVKEDKILDEINQMRNGYSRRSLEKKYPDWDFYDYQPRLRSHLVTLADEAALDKELFQLQLDLELSDNRDAREKITAWLAAV